MLKLLLLALGTWSTVSVFFVGTLGFLLHLRERSALQSATGVRTRASARCVHQVHPPRLPAKAHLLPRAARSSTVGAINGTYNCLRWGMDREPRGSPGTVQPIRPCQAATRRQFNALTANDRAWIVVKLYRQAT